MSNSSSENGNFIVSRNLTEKFEFYLLALVFTVLAFTLQTSEMVNRYYQYCFEIGAWVLFAASGLVGLKRLSWIPVLYKHYGDSQKDKKSISEFKQGLSTGNLVKENGERWQEADMTRVKNELELRNKKRAKVIEKLENLSVINYQIHKWCLYLGLVALIVSRAISHLVKIGVISPS